MILVRVGVTVSCSVHILPLSSQRPFCARPLRDIAANAGASDFELDLLDATLDNCIIYKAATEEFLGIKIERYFGLSMYLPGNGSPYLDSFYRDLAWDAATGLVSGMTEK